MYADGDAGNTPSESPNPNISLNKPAFARTARLDQAQLMLGVIYYSGEGAARDYVTSYKWLALAAAKGRPEAKRFLDEVKGS
jgi:TPR repeat protein